MSASEGRISLVVVVRMVERRDGRDGTLWSLKEMPLGVEDMAAAAGVNRDDG